MTNVEKFDAITDEEKAFIENMGGPYNLYLLGILTYCRRDNRTLADVVDSTMKEYQDKKTRDISHIPKFQKAAQFLIDHNGIFKLKLK